MHPLIHFALICSCIVRYSEAFSSHLLQRRQACDESWIFCSPLSNATWYQNKEYQFAWNKNHSFFVYNMDVRFDIHLLTVSTATERRTIKSWFNLTSANESLAVNVTSNWFPTSLLPNGASNRTWDMYAILLEHNPTEQLSDPTTFTLNSNGNDTPHVEIQVVQLPPPVPVLVSQEQFPAAWKLAIIVAAIVAVLVIIAVCLIVWLYKNMQKQKARAAEASAQSTHTMQTSILSTPDAKMIADTYRQVMSTTSDSDKHRNQVGEDLLKRQLESEGTSVSEIGRRTSSTKQRDSVSLS